ncbi:MAG: hypothetical protein A2070_09715 [Bdellovibrionales bacterium GWC1_52_8]|nr:MAG: hypothetical protein A2070_09715 [Bdellovibrionales bacterium GWC1_52_8]
MNIFFFYCRRFFSIETVITGNFTFSASGGIPPYTFSKFSGDGAMAAGGAYTAAATSGSAVVRVTDSASATSDATVTINDVLSISPTSVSLAVNNTHDFTASAGVPPYTFSVVEGASGGAVTTDTATGHYTAPAAVGAGTYHVRVTDAASSTADATITLTGALAIDPATKVLYVGDPDFTFTATGGVTAYTYSKVSGIGTISAGGVYEVPGAAGSAVVRVTDSLGNQSDASITIKTELTISPASVTLLASGTQAFTASGGTPGYTYSVTEGATGGTVDASGNFTAGTTPGTYHVRVTDSLGWTKDATVIVASPITISPTTPSVEKGGTVNFSGNNGIPDYTFSIQSHTCAGGSGGSIVAGTGVYTAPYEICTAVVRVTDSATNYSETTVSVTHTPATYILQFTNAGDFVQSDSTNGTTFPGTTVELKQVDRTVTHTDDADFSGTHQGTTTSGGSVTLP